MLTLQGVTYKHPNGDGVFTNLNFAVSSGDKTALIGDNGVGKTTLLKIIAGELACSDGVVIAASRPYYVPQIVGQFNHLTVAEVLGVDSKLRALSAILQGDVSDTNMQSLDNDWSIEERCHEAFLQWQLGDINLQTEMQSLSGGQKTKVFLAGITVHQPDIILLDEPSNHLDRDARHLLYQFLTATAKTLVVVSHDRTLLNLLHVTAELSKRGLRYYGGNFDFYMEQKKIENEALMETVRSKERSLRKATAIENESMERQQKLDSRGKKKQEKAGLPTIMMKTLKNSAERSTAKMKEVHADKLRGLSKELHDLRSTLPITDKMKVDLLNSKLHDGKVLVTAQSINFSYGEEMLWEEPKSFQIRSGDRVAIKGVNASGKTTLLNIILGNIQPSVGVVERAMLKSMYVDQEYSVVDDHLSVYDQTQQFNQRALPEHEIKARLKRFLFSKDDWDKPCKSLSGGEKMRLILCALTIGDQTPDLLVLDEPTNNLDLKNIEIMTNAINDYRGTVMVISHDVHFLNAIGITASIAL
ncbi:ABC-F family ATP-binding cassette domain-containing protein [Pseudochryseolinea flava]|uniref:ABC transporter ATP-binding protein n=1 Tax=Pseudochryseolinea flava TaxID=2059302 RepID=A0A364YAK5_9BACT|nr:ABC-F family ATP-binding cassette domain-containing protein [Pseudochryseolinea flava]RAW02888.1 ABC transporter ATP-binding protein [Pseudochryseolinea flava]